MIFNIVIRVLAAHKGLYPSGIRMDTLLADLEIDLMEDIELIMQLEDIFHIELDPDEKTSTVWDLVRLITDARDA